MHENLGSLIHLQMVATRRKMRKVHPLQGKCLTIYSLVLLKAEIFKLNNKKGDKEAQIF